MATGNKGRDTRERIVTSAAELFRRQGYDGTGLNEILERSEAPRGSLYFHFPGGKGQIAVEAVEREGETIGGGIEYVLGSSEDVGEAVGRVVDFLAGDLERSEYWRGCPIAAVTLDAASSSDEIRAALNEAFGRWHKAIASRLRAAGRTRKQATEQAWLVLSAIEGGLLLARAKRDPAPLKAVARQLRTTLAQSG